MGGGDTGNAEVLAEWCSKMCDNVFDVQSTYVWEAACLLSVESVWYNCKCHIQKLSCNFHLLHSHNIKNLGPEATLKIQMSLECYVYPVVWRSEVLGQIIWLPKTHGFSQQGAGLYCAALEEVIFQCHCWWWAIYSAFTVASMFFRVTGHKLCGKWPPHPLGQHTHNPR